MKHENYIPRILVIDDLFGRTHPDRRNEDRSNLCGQYLFEDVTGDETGKGSLQKIKKPVAQVVFYRGQKPQCSTVGETVENDLKGTLQIVREGWGEWTKAKPRWAMVLLDLCFYTGRVTKESNRRTLGMPEGRDSDDDPKQYFGLRILQNLHTKFPNLPVIIFSSKSREEVSNAFSQRGALGFLAREDPGSPALLEDYIWRHGLLPDDTGEVAGHSKSLFLALRAARRVAAGRQNCLLRGGRGTGKELFARYIHRQRKGQLDDPFVVVNSSVLTPDLFASELFGIEKSVATGVDKRKGLVRSANGGDLFLDEIGDMPLQVQAGMLRVLEEGMVTPVGAKSPEQVDVCFLSATNKDIEALVAADVFRPDLLDRLRESGTIILPSLKERMADIPTLAEKFVRDAEQMNPGAQKREIDPEAIERLFSYDWPGNVRELRSCIFNAVNNNPDVELLAPIHLQFGDERTSELRSTSVHVPRERTAEREGVQKDFSALMGDMSGVGFDPSNPQQLMAKLPELESEYALLVARYLKAALVAARQLPTPDYPEGKIQIHPAVKLITGDSGLSGSKAADIVKRLLKHKAVEPLLEEDRVLKTAYETALRLRPSRSKSSRKNNN